MQVDVTARTPSGEQDFRVFGADGTPAGTVIAAVISAAGEALGDAVGAAAGQAGAVEPPPADLVVRDGTIIDTATGAICDVDDRGRGGQTPDPRNTGTLRVDVTGGRCAGRSVAVGPGSVVVGRAPECTVQLDDARVSRRHAELLVTSRGVTVRNLDSTNGVLLDGVPVGQHPVPLPLGALLKVGDSQLVLRRRDAGARAALAHAGTRLTVTRGRRGSEPVPDAAVHLPEHERRSVRRLVALAVAAVAPVAAGAMVALVTGSTSLLIFALLSPIGVLAGAAGGGRSARGSGRRACRRAMRQAREQVAAGLRAEAAARRAAAPDAAALAHLAALPGAGLWQRDPSAADFLRVRLGSADRPSHLRVRRNRHESPAGRVPAVPVVVNLLDGPLGIVGPAAPVRALARFVLAQAAVLHPPSNLAISLLVPPDPGWHWARWLPHPGERAASSVAAAVALLAELRATASPRRHALVVIDAFPGGADAGWLADGLEDVPQLHALCLAPDVASLPLGCRTLVRLDAADDAVAALHADGAAPETFVADLVTENWAQRVARSLAPLREARDAPEPAGDLLALLDIEPDPDVAAITRRWQADPLSLRTTIGTGRAGPIEIDLAVDGPHALIAGTTGAGKSALLRSLVLGLALTHSPSDVSFLLVDYKGGAAFAACAELPHATGVVTDLDAQRTRRALRSLDAEIRRRERLLAAAGAGDFAAYRAGSPGSPLARLVVVVDEFATLAEDLPDFVPGLVDVAQRGRSLGMHLVLATQRPGRAVTPEIRANTSLRIALRVTDPAESVDVVGVADAARIPAGQPGSGVLSVAGSEATPFRAAVPGRRDERARAEPLGPWRRPAGAEPWPGDGTDEVTLDAVRRLCEAARESSISLPAAPWLPPLPDRVPAAPSAQPALGLVDLPERQQQGPLTLDPDAGSAVLVCGAARSGRSAALATAALLVAEVRSPAQQAVYAVDRDGTLAAQLAGLPQLATALPATDPGLVVRLLQRLREPRTGTGSGLLLLDDWDAVCAEAGEVRTAELQAALADLLRTAPALRLTTVATAARPLPASRRGARFTDTLLLRLTDRADYPLAGVAAADVPHRLPPGRGVRAADGVEFQLAWAGADLQPRISAMAKRWRAVPLHEDAVRFRSLPDAVAVDGCGPPGPALRLGVGSDEARPVTVDPAAGHLIVAGGARSGRSTVLLVLLAEARRLGLPVLVAAPDRSPLAEHARQLGVPLLRPADAADSAAHVAVAVGRAALLLVDDCESFDGSPAGEQLWTWLREAGRGFLGVVAGRAEAMAAAYRGPAAEAKRNRRGVLLQPTPLDGELLGVRIDRAAPRERRPGRGVAVGLTVGDPGSASGSRADDAVPLQVALP